MTISATIPSPLPSRSQTPEVFVPAMDAWIAAQVAYAAQIDAAAQAFNFNATNSTSTTSIAIAIASKSLTVQASKSYVEGQSVTIARTSDATKWMRGEVTSYNSGTGALVVNVRTVSAAGGTFTDWTISQAAVEGLVNYSKVLVHTGNGQGSVATQIRRFTTALINTGTGLTYADDASGGGTITVNESGLYLVKSGDTKSSGTGSWGVSVNSNQLTTSYPSITSAHQVDGAANMEVNTTAGSRYNQLVSLEKFVPGDVLRHHGNSVNDGTTAQTFLSVTKVANI